MKTCKNCVQKNTGTTGDYTQECKNKYYTQQYLKNVWTFDKERRQELEDIINLTIASQCGGYKCKKEDNQKHYKDIVFDFPIKFAGIRVLIKRDDTGKWKTLEIEDMFLGHSFGHESFNIQGLQQYQDMKFNINLFLCKGSIYISANDSQVWCEIKGKIYLGRILGWHSFDKTSETRYYKQGNINE